MASIYTTSVLENMQEYEFANRAWKSTCKVLFGGEIGELESYSNYLSQYIELRKQASSFLSGKKIAINSQNYCKGSKFISHDEMAQYGKKTASAKLDVNSLNDLDSLLDAVSGQVCYVGNMVTGNSSYVFESDMVSNSNFIYKCVEVYNSKYAAYSSMSRSDEYVFGLNWSGNSRFCIRTNENFDLTRGFETLSCRIDSDCYYCANLSNCNDCLFCFNNKNMRNAIGNLVLEKADYQKKKAELLAQIRDDLQSKKNILSILDLLGGKND